MCKYCEQGKMIDLDEATWNIQNIEESYEMKYENNEVRMTHGIIISYCPICGRKLTGEENEERCKQKESIDKIEKLNERHQSDCITINQLNVTIDVLVDKLARLREVRGL